MVQLLWDTQKVHHEITRCDKLGPEARVIKSGETPQKSPILPPVHVSVFRVFALNICIYYKNLGILRTLFLTKIMKNDDFHPPESLKK